VARVAFPAVSSTAALLTTVASLLVGHHVPVACQHPPGIPWTDNVYGYTVWEGRQASIYLRSCRRTRLRVRWAVTVFSHELIHVEHPDWSHPRVYRWADWYGRTVVGPKIASLERPGRGLDPAD
jgi:hypothetical protein